MNYEVCDTHSMKSLPLRECQLVTSTLTLFHLRLAPYISASSVSWLHLLPSLQGSFPSAGAQAVQAVFLSLHNLVEGRYFAELLR